MMQIEMIPIDQVREYEKNPRKNDAAVEPVARSIKEFGFKVPVIVDAGNVLVAGHTRVRAATELGMTEVPAIRASDLTPEQIRAFRIADNQLSALADWDFGLLTTELQELRLTGLDLTLLGFDEYELAELLQGELKEGLTDPDLAPGLPDAAVTQSGDLWILGSHRLRCGDSAQPEDVDRLLDGQPIHLVSSDPPYGVRVEPRSNNAIAAGLSSFTASKSLHHQQMDVARHPEKARATHKRLRPKDRPLANDFLADEDFHRLLDAWFANFARALQPGRAFYIWGGYANLGNYPPYLKKHQLYFSQGVVWDKEHPVLTRKDFMGAFEICFYGWKEGAAHQFFGPNNATDLWHVKKINPLQMQHLTQKPVELSTRALQYSSRPGENVLDLFGGSGSTLIAAEQSGRRAFLMELDPLYCDLIVDRFQRFTGQPAVLERTGQSPIPMKPREENMR